MNQTLVYLFLIVAGSPVAHVGTYSEMAACQAAVAQSVPKPVGTAPGFVYLCVHANDAKVTPPRN